MDFDGEFDQRVASDKEEDFLDLSAFYQLRPARASWREDVERAPLMRPVYAREAANAHILIAMRDEAGWVSVSRDGECAPAETIVAWAPLQAALG